MAARPLWQQRPQHLAGCSMMLRLIRQPSHIRKLDAVARSPVPVAGPNAGAAPQRLHPVAQVRSHAPTP